MQLRSFGIILSVFDEVLGPIPISSAHITLDQSSQSQIASKTVDLLLEDSVLPKEASIVDFPVLNKKGLVKAFRWVDPHKRGMTGQGTITILFDPPDEFSFIKFRDDLDPLFADFIHIFTKIRKDHPTQLDFTPQLEFLLHKIESTVLYLSDTELSNQSDQEFPPEQETHEEPELSFKVIIVGDEMVGKTSTILRYVDRAFRRSYIPTIGVNISIKNFTVTEHSYQFMLWDLAGQSKFSSIRRQFYKGADAIVLIFDLTRRSTFENIPKWYADLKVNVPDFVKKVVYLCGNKADLTQDIVIKRQEIVEVAKSLKLPYLEISALTGQSINYLFEKLGQKLVEIVAYPVIS
jgi:small GTP-binding protein